MMCHLNQSIKDEAFDKAITASAGRDIFIYIYIYIFFFYNNIVHKERKTN